MELAQRFYSGPSFRPRPLVEKLPAQSTLIVATSWGEPEHAQKVVDFIREHLVQSVSPEATRIGPYVADLSERTNQMRSAVLFANEQLHLKENSKEYRSAVEIALIHFDKKVLSWVQVGNPHLILKTLRGLQPLATQPDWSWQMQQDTPLVCKALGLERTCYPHCGSHRLMQDEQLVLVSRSSVPSKFYALENVNIAACSSALVEDQSEAPFWIGILNF